MNKVFLFAYDKINLGDDLFIRNITERYPDTRFYLLTTQNNRKVFENVKNLKILDKYSRKRMLLNRIRPSLINRLNTWYQKRCDAVVYIGGSIFIEYDTWKNMLNWWNYEVANFPFYVLGANFGPFHNEEYKEGMDAIFSKMKDVCFRDQYSYKLFSTNSVVRQAPDILFSFHIPQTNIQSGQIVISVINCRNKEDNLLKSVANDYIAGMTKLIKNFIDYNYTPILVSFCKEEGDEETISEILSCMQPSYSERCSTLFYNGINYDQILRKIAGSEYIIAARFHALILALAANRPVYPMIYSDKTIHVLETIGFAGEYLDIRKNGEYDYTKVICNLYSQNSVDIEKLKRDAEMHYLKLDKLLLS